MNAHTHTPLGQPLGHRSTTGGRGKRTPRGHDEKHAKPRNHTPIWLSALPSPPLGCGRLPLPLALLRVTMMADILGMIMILRRWDNPGHETGERGVGTPPRPCARRRALGQPHGSRLDATRAHAAYTTRTSHGRVLSRPKPYRSRIHAALSRMSGTSITIYDSSAGWICTSHILLSRIPYRRSRRTA